MSDGTPPAGDVTPVPATIDPQALAALAAALGGSINVTIKVGDNTYTLAVTIPTSAGTAYGLSLIETPKSGTADTLAQFSYTPGGDFSVAANLPTITSGDTTITAGFSLTGS